MALPSSGTITMSQIVAEFGGSGTHGLSEYYRGGGYVPNTGANAAVPTSGTIKFSDFYGATAFNHAATLPSNIVAYGRTFDYPSGEAYATCWFGLDDAVGRFFLYGTPEAHTIIPMYDNTWLTGDGTGSDYEVMFEVTSEMIYEGSPPNTWINIGTQPVFYVFCNWANIEGNAQGTLKIRPAGGGSVLAEAPMQLWAFFDV